MDIIINVVNQKLKIATNLKSLVSGTHEFIRFRFNLSGDWSSLVSYAQFTQDGKAYNVYLDSNNSVYLPPEIGKGVCGLALRGTKGNTIAVTEQLLLSVSQNPVVDGLASTGVTLSLYEQLVNRVDSLLEDDGLIIETTERILQEYLEDEKFSAMALGDHSVEVHKLSYDAIATNAEIIEYLGVKV